MTSTRRGSRTLLGLLGALTVAAALLGGQQDAAAHSDLTRSSPTAGSSGRTPEEIRLTFSDDVEPSFAAVTLSVDEAEPSRLSSRVSGAEVRATPPDVAADDTPQQWKVAYRVVSQDGHPITGSLTFTITPAAASTGPSTGGGVDTATPPPAPAASPASGASPTPSPAASAPTLRPGFPSASDRHGDGGWFIIAVMAATLLLVPAAAGLFSFLPSHEPDVEPDPRGESDEEPTDVPVDPDSSANAATAVTGSATTGPEPGDGGPAEPRHEPGPGRESPPAP